MKLIGINGFKGSGKDTAYGFLREAAGPTAARRRGFADKLKVMAALALGYEGEPGALIAKMDVLKNEGIVHSKLTDDLTNATMGTTLTGRKYLQRFGGKARDVFGDTFWVDQVVPLNGADRAALWNTETAFDSTPVGLPSWGVITDVRYPNEAERVLALGGDVWEIVRGDLESDGDASEQPLPRNLVTATLHNNADLDAFRALVEFQLDWTAREIGLSA